MNFACVKHQAQSGFLSGPIKSKKKKKKKKKKNSISGGVSQSGRGAKNGKRGNFFDDRIYQAGEKGFGKLNQFVRNGLIV